MKLRLFVGFLVAMVPVVIFICFWHGTAQKDALAMEAAVTNDLSSLYQNIAKPITNQADLMPDAIVSALMDNKYHHSTFLSGVSNPTNIYVMSETTKPGKTNLICVVRLVDEVLYGIDAKGLCRRVTQGELRYWPHVCLSDRVQ